MKKIWYGLCFLCVGCSLSQEEFEVESVGITCERIFECLEGVPEVFGFSDQEGCFDVLSDLMIEESTNCVYDAQKAQACIEELETVSCEEFTPNQGSENCSDAIICEEAIE